MTTTPNTSAPVAELGYVTLGGRVWAARRTLSKGVQIDLRHHKMGSRKSWSVPITNTKVLASWVPDGTQPQVGESR